MTDRIPDSSTENCTAALAHLAFCALVALAFARRDGVAGTPGADNLFLVRWLATAQKQKRFPKSVAVDIAWLLARGRKHGPAGRLVQHLEYLWRSCSGDLKAQSCLFRLTWATETLKDRGWDSVVFSGRLKPETFPAGRNAFYVTKGILSAYSALFDHGLASKFDQRFASVGVSLEIVNFCTLSALFNQSWFVRG